ncbi:hypothetical protein GQX74_007307 [Glossina fuscipes]|nr:hypothetical protein GQX74_007307 [Glossina fuscipes]
MFSYSAIDFSMEAYLSANHCSRKSLALEFAANFQICLLILLRPKSKTNKLRSLSLPLSPLAFLSLPDYL